MRVTPLESDLVENKRYLYFLATNEGIQESFTHQKNPTNLRNKNQERFAGHTSSEGVGQFHNSAQREASSYLTNVEGELLVHQKIQVQSLTMLSSQLNRLY